MRGSFGPAVLVGIGAASLTAVAAAGDWAESSGDNAGVAATAVVDGADTAPLALALALVTLASWGVLLVLRGRLRRVAAAVGATAAAGVLAVVVTAFGTAQDDAATAARAVGATSDTVETSLTGWYWTTGLAATLSLAALAVGVARAPGWPAMGARYDNPAAARDNAPAAEDDLWRALDEGRDPTA